MAGEIKLFISKRYFTISKSFQMSKSFELAVNLVQIFKSTMEVYRKFSLPANESFSRKSTTKNLAISKYSEISFTEFKIWVHECIGFLNVA